MMIYGTDCSSESNERNKNDEKDLPNFETKIIKASFIKRDSIKKPNT